MEESTLVKSLSVVFCFFRGDIAVRRVVCGSDESRLRHAFTTLVYDTRCTRNRPDSS